jgi:aryl-alcohol dehydrogenase-like predicted oxidoreductase
MGFGDTKSGFNTWAVGRDDCKKVVRGAFDLGVNFFDTANCYSYGTSEEYLGEAIKDLPREEIVVATKVYNSMRLSNEKSDRFFSGRRPLPNGGGLSRKEIIYECEQSLKRLKLDYIDLYIIHRWDYSTPIEETMRALNDLVTSGKVRYLGASAMFAWQFEKAQFTAEKHGWSKFISMQNHYNLLYREEEREMIPLCRDQGVSCTPYSPLASGRLAHDWSAQTPRAKTDQVVIRKYGATAGIDKPVADRVAEVAKQHGVPMAQIACAWLLSKDVVASPIIGANKMAYIEDAVKALDVELSEEEIHYLEEKYQPHPVVGAE